MLDAIEALGYRPNAAAQSLASGKRSMIAVLTGKIDDVGWTSTIQGIADAARERGLSVMVTLIESAAPEHVHEAVSRALSQPIAGAVALAYDAPGYAALTAFPRSVPLLEATPLLELIVVTLPEARTNRLREVAGCYQVPLLVHRQR